MLQIRNALPEEFEKIGQLVADVYSRLPGFPKREDQPAYYNILDNIGEFCTKPETELLVATNENNHIIGAVVYFADMRYYGSGGVATRKLDTSGFRLLAVSNESRGQGAGKMLTMECIRKARMRKQKSVIIHTTLAMQQAWKMYEKMGFRRSADLDFMQGNLPVFGFRYHLGETLL